MGKGLQEVVHDALPQPTEDNYPKEDKIHVVPASAIGFCGVIVVGHVEKLARAGASSGEAQVGQSKKA